MRSGQRLVLLVYTLAPGALLACSDGLTPALGERYLLRTIAGEGLPAVIARTENFTVRVISGTLHLSPDGKGIVSTVREVEGPGESSPTRTRSTSAVSWVRTSDRIELIFTCPPNASCVAPPHLVGRVDGQRLVFEIAFNEPVPQVYERVSD
ncbi:MAG TPA: hypothetical protein VJ596_07870 [Gemmatimonadaceae bacterium]|nr:hypothetical protein [Gemmatimonadaceae bacterium]